MSFYTTTAAVRHVMDARTSPRSTTSASSSLSGHSYQQDWTHGSKQQGNSPYVSALAYTTKLSSAYAPPMYTSAGGYRGSSYISDEDLFGNPEEMPYLSEAPSPPRPSTAYTIITPPLPPLVAPEKRKSKSNKHHSITPTHRKTGSRSSSASEKGMVPMQNG